MNSRVRPVLGAALVLCLMGCAPPKVCQIIPKQLELARNDRDQIQQQVETKKGEVGRAQENLDIAQKRLDQMHQEQKDLEAKLAKQAADSAATAGRKK